MDLSGDYNVNLVSTSRQHQPACGRLGNATRAVRLRLNALCFLYAKDEPIELPAGACERERKHNLRADASI